MSNKRVRDIAMLLAEDSSLKPIISAYSRAWERETCLELSDYYNVVGLLKKTAENNGCELDIGRLTVKLIEPGFIIKNVLVHCPDIQKQRELSKRLSQQLDKQDIKHEFEHELHVYLYQSINKEFAQLVREELGLEVGHHKNDVGPNSKVAKKDLLPMISIFAIEKVEEPEPEEMPMEDDFGVEDMAAGLDDGMGDMEDEEFQDDSTGGEDLAIPDENGIEDLGDQSGPAQPVEPEEDELAQFESISRMARFLSEDINHFGE